MEKWVIAIFIVLLIIVTIVLLVIFYMIRKGVRFVKRVITGDVSEEEFERLSKEPVRKRINSSAIRHAPSVQPAPPLME